MASQIELTNIASGEVRLGVVRHRLIPHREMAIRKARRTGGGEHVRTRGNLAGVAHVDDCPQTSVNEKSLPRSIQLVQAVGAVQRTPARAPAIARRVAAEVAQIARADEPEEPNILGLHASEYALSSRNGRRRGSPPTPHHLY